MMCALSFEPDFETWNFNGLMSFQIPFIVQSKWTFEWMFNGLRWIRHLKCQNKHKIIVQFHSLAHNFVHLFPLKFCFVWDTIITVINWINKVASNNCVCVVCASVLCLFTLFIFGLLTQSSTIVDIKLPKLWSHSIGELIRAKQSVETFHNRDWRRPFSEQYSYKMITITDLR